MHTSNSCHIMFINFKMPQTAARRKYFYSSTFNPENVFRPACFIEIFNSNNLRNHRSSRAEDYTDIRFYAFDYPFCDRSLWNSSDGNAFSPVDDVEANEERNTLKFLIQGDDIVHAHLTLLTMQQNPVPEEEEAIAKPQSDKELSSGSESDI